MDPRLAHRLAEQGAKVEGSTTTPVQHEEGPCSTYILDMGRPFGDCKCGFPKAAHSMPSPARPRPSKGTPNKMLPMPSQGVNEGVLLARNRRKKAKADALAAVEGALTADSGGLPVALEMITAALEQAKDAMVEGYKLVDAVRRHDVLTTRATLRDAATLADPHRITSIIEYSLRFSDEQSELYEERAAAMRQRQIILNQAALARLEASLEEGVLDAIDEAIEQVSKLISDPNRFHLAESSLQLEVEHASACTKRTDLVREAATMCLHEQVNTQVDGQSSLDVNALIGPLLAEINRAKADGVDETSIQVAQARLKELRHEDARTRITTAGMQIEALIKAIETARSVWLAPQEIMDAEKRLHAAQHERARRMLHDALDKAQNSTEAPTEDDVIALLQNGIDHAREVQLPRTDCVEAAVTRLLALKQQRAYLKLEQALEEQDITKVSIAIHEASQALAFGQACPLRDEIEAAQRRLFELEELSWASYLESVLPDERPEDPGTPSELQARKERLKAAVTRLQSEGCPTSLLSSPRAHLVTLEGRLAMVTRLVEEVEEAAAEESTERLQQALRAAREGGVPAVFPPLRSAANLLEQLQLEARVASEKAEWSQLCGREFDLPNEFLCPITCSKLIDPMVAADGHTYEREAIQKWLVERGTKSVSPLTGQTLKYRELVPNFSLKKHIEGFEAEQFSCFREIRDALIVQLGTRRREQALGTPLAAPMPRRAHTEPARRYGVTRDTLAAPSAPNTPTAAVTAVGEHATGTRLTPLEH